MMGSAKRGLTAKDLERIHGEHVTAMYRHGLALLRDETAVRDLLQDVFLKLAEGRVDPGDLESERAYLLRMIHHGAIDRLRRDKVRRDHVEKTPEEIFQSSPDPDREAFRRQLERALDQLPPEQREIVILKLWEERTFDEISKICGISLNTAASRYRYALDKLRGFLRPTYEEL
ncbi:RNA polymerase sigma factor [Luteolibacter luteus]|uniref:RNA polymerase sigma factor n=1 Tax=Luteolibacter luteus TaxID=2728835 RepID=A0A858RH61_9BACT|nr:RNA polymerase sigma factor [Luteolibacter luteus]QJE95610.1 RNA polymerase sigma factor [Luteolibacter luteus]